MKRIRAAAALLCLAGGDLGRSRDGGARLQRRDHGDPRRRPGRSTPTTADPASCGYTRRATAWPGCGPAASRSAVCTSTRPYLWLEVLKPLVARLATAGWIALGEGKSDDALKFMRAAADLEDSNEKHIVTPGRIVPARELLGDMLLEMKQPEAALKEFEASQRREPNRFRNFLGSAQAAQMAGDREKAASYYQ